MPTELEKSMLVSSAGLRAQNMRMRIIAENLANMDSMPTQPGESPYQRKMITFKNVMDAEMGIKKVQIDKIIRDQSEFGTKYDPGNPMADADGYIETSNVKGLVEMMDMRQAQRTFEANINAIEATKKMMLQTLELLR